MKILEPDLVFAHVKATSSDEIIHYLAQKLQNKGKVKISFEQAVKNESYFTLLACLAVKSQ